jgi:hypothetical protein
MLSPQDTEETAREFCQIMGFEPDEVRRVSGKKIEAWKIAACQIQEHLAIQVALQNVLRRKGPPPDVADRIPRVIQINGN